MAERGDIETVENILKEARRRCDRGERVLTVFDLDSTLFDLSIRIAEIIDAFASDPTWTKRFPEECRTLGRAEIRPGDWGIGESLRRLGLSEEQNLEFWKELHRFWSECFFSNDFLHHDEPLPGAVVFVSRLRSLGAEIMYLTGRDIPRMLEGTQKSLRERGFPVDDHRAKLVLKPNAEMDDAWFKLAVLQTEITSFDKIWLFENEPVNINLIARECPSVDLVFIETTHSKRELPPAEVTRIRRF